MGKRGAAKEETTDQLGDERLARIKRRCGHCGLCKAVMRDLVGHCSRRPQCKHHPATRPLTEEEMAAVIDDFNEEHANPELLERRHSSDMAGFARGFGFGRARGHFGAVGSKPNEGSN